MEEEKIGGETSSSFAPVATGVASSSAAVVHDRRRFFVELRPGETTIVSWKKLIKDANKANRSLPSAEPPIGAHPALESRIAPGQPVECEAKDAPPSNRYSAVIEKIERLYMGNQSSDEAELDDVPDDDQYDTEDSFIDDVELRWAIIRKRKANLGVVNNAAGSQLSEAQLAARRAVNLALKMPVIDNLSMACSAGTASTHSTSISRSSVPPAPAEASHASSTPMEAKTSTKIAVSSCSSQSQLQSHQPPHQTAGLLQTGTSSTTPRSRATTKKSSSTPVTSTLSPNPMVQAAAVAAGARIATASTAASLYKAAHSKNAVHIRPGGASLIKTSMAGGTKPLTVNHAGPRPSVHYIRTGLASPPPATYSGVMPTVSRSVGNKQPYGNSVRPASPTSQTPLASATSSLKLSAQQTKLASSMGAISCGNAESMRNNATAPMGGGLLSKEEDKSGIEMKVFDSDNVVEERVQYDQAVLSNSEAVSENQTTVVENLRVSPNMEADLDSHTAVVNNEIDENQNVSEKMTSSPVTEGCENQSMVIKTGEDQNLIRKQTDVPSMATCGSGDKHTVIGIEVPRDKLTGEKQKEKLG